MRTAKPRAVLELIKTTGWRAARRALAFKRWSAYMKYCHSAFGYIDIHHPSEAMALCQGSSETDQATTLCCLQRSIILALSPP